MQSVILVSADELPWLVRFRYDEKIKCWNPPYNQFIMSGLGIRFSSPAFFVAQNQSIFLHSLGYGTGFLCQNVVNCYQDIIFGEDIYHEKSSGDRTG